VQNLARRKDGPNFVCTDATVSSITPNKPNNANMSK